MNYRKYEININVIFFLRERTHIFSIFPLVFFSLKVTNCDLEHSINSPFINSNIKSSTPPRESHPNSDSAPASESQPLLPSGPNPTVLQMHNTVFHRNHACTSSVYTYAYNDGTNACTNHTTLHPLEKPEFHPGKLLRPPILPL